MGINGMMMGEHALREFRGAFTDRGGREKEQTGVPQGKQHHPGWERTAKDCVGRNERASQGRRRAEAAATTKRDEETRARLEKEEERAVITAARQRVEEEARKSIEEKLEVEQRALEEKERRDKLMGQASIEGGAEQEMRHAATAAAEGDLHGLLGAGHGEEVNERMVRRKFLQFHPDKTDGAGAMGVTKAIGNAKSALRGDAATAIEDMRKAGNEAVTAMDEAKSRRVEEARGHAQEARTAWEQASAETETERVRGDAAAAEAFTIEEREREAFMRADMPPPRKAAAESEGKLAAGRAWEAMERERAAEDSGTDQEEGCEDESNARWAEEFLSGGKGWLARGEVYIGRGERVGDADAEVDTDATGPLGKLTFSGDRGDLEAAGVELHRELLRRLSENLEVSVNEMAAERQLSVRIEYQTDDQAIMRNTALEEMASGVRSGCRYRLRCRCSQPEEAPGEWCHCEDIRNHVMARAGVVILAGLKNQHEEDAGAENEYGWAENEYGNMCMEVEESWREEGHGEAMIREERERENGEPTEGTRGDEKETTTGVGEMDVAATAAE